MLTSLIVAFASASEDAYFKWILFYCALFFCISLLVFKIGKRMIVTGVAINLFLWLAPFVPLCLVADYYAEMKSNRQFDYIIDYGLQQQHLLWAGDGWVMFITYVRYVLLQGLPDMVCSSGGLVAEILILYVFTSKTLRPKEIGKAGIIN